MGLITETRIYECDNCKKRAAWSDGWRHRMYLHMKGMWDETVTACSPECADSIEKRRARGRKKSTQHLPSNSANPHDTRDETA